jgi:hypothetical protein
MRYDICGEPIVLIDIADILRLDVEICQDFKTTKTR